MKTFLTLALTTLGTAAVLLGQFESSASGGGKGDGKADGGVAGGSTDCATAVAAVVGANAFNTSSATGSIAVGAGGTCGAHTIYKPNYFTFTPATTGSYTIATCSNSTWDTRIAVNAACGANLSPIACNDDGCGTQSSAVGTFTGGVTYRIIVGGFGSGDSGAGSILISSGGGSGGGTIGPDVIVGAIPDISKYGSVVVSGQTIMAYAIGTTSCNIGDALLDWFASPDNRHPFIPQNIYRIKSGRIEQIGLGWGKHGFTALQGTLCGSCTPSSSGNWLGVGCSDPYSSGLNGSQGGCGTRSEVNGATGVFPGTYNSGMPAAPATIGRRIQVNGNDLNPTLNPSATYLVEAQYYHPGDASAGNDNNNASWRSITVGSLSAGAYGLTLTGVTNQQKAAIEAWKTADAAVTLVNADVALDGRFILGYKVTDNGNGTWHYEYAVQNLNSDRSGQSFSIPLPAGTVVTGSGFHDVNYHSGDPYSLTDWVFTSTGGAAKWTGGTYATSVNSNALRLSTIYNFWFDANRAPTAVNATLGLFKPGASPSITIAAQGPAAAAGNPSDLDFDGLVNGADLAILLNNWGGTGLGDINNDSVVNGADLAELLNAWG
jgi:hypothetical protein